MSALFRAVLVVLVLFGSAAHAADRLTLGVFAFRPKSIMIERYQPLADYLSEKLGGTRVELEVLEQDELDEAVAAHRVDLVMTNPSHYLELRSHNSLSGALATLVSSEGGQAVSSLGGCIIVRAGRGDITGLRDLRGRRVAISGPRFLGGYQAQAFELMQVGVRVPDQVDLLVVGRHDAVVEAVLEGRADAGFIRTGIIESLVAEGRLDASQLVVLNPQALAVFTIRRTRPSNRFNSQDPPSSVFAEKSKTLAIRRPFDQAGGRRPSHTGQCRVEDRATGLRIASVNGNSSTISPVASVTSSTALRIARCSPSDLRISRIVFRAARQA